MSSSLEPITESHFVIKRTGSGVSLKWRHNNKTIRHFCSSDIHSNLDRATKLIEFLIDWNKHEGIKFDREQNTVVRC